MLRFLPQIITLLMLSENQITSILYECPEALCLWGHQGFDFKDCRTLTLNGEPLVYYFCSLCGGAHRKENSAARGCSLLPVGIYHILNAQMPRDMEERREHASEHHLRAMDTLPGKLDFWFGRLMTNDGRVRN